MEGKSREWSQCLLGEPSMTETQTSGCRGSKSEEGWRRVVLCGAAESEEGNNLVHT